jgi:hypothetical protein
MTTGTKELMRMMHKQIYEEKRELFFSLGKGGRYTKEQKQYAFELIRLLGSEGLDIIRMSILDSEAQEVCAIV